MHVHFASREVIVLVFFQRIVPTSQLVIDVSTESVFELVESMHGVRGIGVGGNAEHIVFVAVVFAGYLDGFPLKGIGGHHVSHLRSGGTVQISSPMGREYQEHGSQGCFVVIGDE